MPDVPEGPVDDAAVGDARRAAAPDEPWTRSGRAVPVAAPAGGPDVTPELVTATETRASLRAAREAAARAQRLTGPAGAALVPVPLVTVASAVGLAALVAVSALTGQVPTGLAVAFAAVVLAYGWTRLLEAPTPGWGALVVGAGGVAVALTAALTPDEPLLRWVPASLGVSLVVGFLQQLLRRERAGLTLGLTAVVGGLSVVSMGVPVVVLPFYARGSAHVVVAMTAVALAALTELLGRVGSVQRWLLLPVLVAGGAGAGLASLLLDATAVLPATLLGVLVAGVSHVLRRVLAPLPGAAGLAARLAIGAASVLSVGVLVYLVTRLLVA